MRAPARTRTYIVLARHPFSVGAAARGRAQVSVAAAITDWPKRIRDMQHIDHEDYAADYE